MLIGIDCDGIVDDLHKEWLKVYNKIWNDNLRIKNITDWDISKFVKPECGSKIIDLLTPELYQNISPISGAKEGVEDLRNKGYRIIFITTPTKLTFGTKYFWLKQPGFLKSDKEYIETFDKSILAVDILIDDKFENVKNCKGIGILYNKPWNISYNYPKELRANNWKDVIKIVKKIEEKHDIT